MTRLAVNLLPEEFKIQQFKRAKFYKIQTIGIVVIVFLVAASISVVGFRFLQSQNVVKIQQRVAFAEEKITSLNKTQGSLILLKNRLAIISKFLGMSSKGVDVFNFLINNLPPSVTINSISIDKEGKLLLSAVATDAGSLEELFGKLTNREINENKIKEVSLETLSRGRDGLYRLNFTVKPE